MSCEWFKLIIISPIVINNKDLKRAWTNKWKKLKDNKPEEKANPINPKCLKVDNAISFFRSVSQIEFKPA